MFIVEDAEQHQASENPPVYKIVVESSTSSSIKKGFHPSLEKDVDVVDVLRQMMNQHRIIGFILPGCAFLHHLLR